MATLVSNTDWLWVWISRLPAFVTAFAAACVLVRATRFVTELAVAHPVLWKKLDEEDLPLEYMPVDEDEDAPA